jgi:hypothetical protein
MEEGTPRAAVVEPDAGRGGKGAPEARPSLRALHRERMMAGIKFLAKRLDLEVNKAKSAIRTAAWANRESDQAVPRRRSARFKTRVREATRAGQRQKASRRSSKELGALARRTARRLRVRQTPSLLREPWTRPRLRTWKQWKNDAVRGTDQARRDLAAQTAGSRAVPGGSATPRSGDHLAECHLRRARLPSLVLRKPQSKRAADTTLPGGEGSAVRPKFELGRSRFPPGDFFTPMGTFSRLMRILPSQLNRRVNDLASR